MERHIFFLSKHGIAWEFVGPCNPLVGTQNYLGGWQPNTLCWSYPHGRDFKERCLCFTKFANSYRTTHTTSALPLVWWEECLLLGEGGCMSHLQNAHRDCRSTIHIGTIWAYAMTLTWHLFSEAIHGANFSSRDQPRYHHTSKVEARRCIAFRKGPIYWQKVQAWCLILDV